MTVAPPREVGAFLRAGGEEIFTLLTLPEGVPRNQAVVLLQGGAWTPSFGRGRGLRRLAHRLAAEGFHVARFDYHGVGESSGEVRTFQLDHPFTVDLAAVVRWLATDYGLERYLLIGTCFGARTALAAAPNIAGLEGLAMFPPPVRDHALGEQFSSYSLSWYLRRLFRARTFKRLLNPRFRRAYRRLFRSKVRAVGHGLHNPADPKVRSPEVSPIFLRQLKSLIARSIPIYLLYGEADADYDDFNRALSGELGAIINSAGQQVGVEVIKGHVHGMTNIDNQDRVIELLAEWATSARTLGGSA